MSHYKDATIIEKYELRRKAERTEAMIEVYKIWIGRYDKKVADDIIEVCRNKRLGSIRWSWTKRDVDLTFENIISQIELLIFGMIYQSVVSANTMFTSENRLDKLYWANQPLKYDFNSDYITGRDKSIVYEEEQNILAISQRSESP